MAKISLLPKKKERIKRPSSALVLTVAFIILAVVLLGYFISLGYRYTLKGKAGDLEKEIEMMGTKSDKEFEQEILGLQKRMTNLKTLISSHVYWSDMFEEIDELTVANVQFEGFSGDMAGEMTLEGKGANYSAVAKQLVSFLGSDKIEDADLSDISLTTEGLVQFSMRLSFKKQSLLAEEE